ncbi:MAG TPA: OmpA family protein, partial [Thermoanaerobaculia bacterium]|nr:OmpA family protein [Thermoanaerobaculia bacterium]
SPRVSRVLPAVARAALEAYAAWLRKHPTVKLTVEGHCDERGTRGYNMALGERRASAVREFLATLGVEPSRAKAVSYGKERPFCREHNESCWQENRRGPFVVTARREPGRRAVLTTSGDTSPLPRTSDPTCEHLPCRRGNLPEPAAASAGVV